MSPPVTDIATGRPAQLVLELSAPPATAETPLVPVRMVNEFVYCPRLAFLEWVDGEWADSGDTEEGRRAHVRVDSGGGRLPAPEAIDDKPDFAARSVTLASDALGIIAKMDLVEGDDGIVTPVDTKKGKRPHVAEGAYRPNPPPEGVKIGRRYGVKFGRRLTATRSFGTSGRTQKPNPTDSLSSMKRTIFRSPFTRSVTPGTPLCSWIFGPNVTSTFTDQEQSLI